MMFRDTFLRNLKSVAIYFAYWSSVLGSKQERRREVSPLILQIRDSIVHVQFFDPGSGIYPASTAIGVSSKRSSHCEKTTCRRYRFEPESVNYPFKSYDRFVYPCHLTRDCFCRCTGQSKPNSKFGCNTKSKKIMANNRFYEKHSRLIFLPLLDIQKYSLSNAVRRIEGIMVLFDYCRFGSMTEITSRPPFSALLDKNIRMCLVT